jgi:light-regulated signal transduction histidine kinase (bacteriophytochrome)
MASATQRALATRAIVAAGLIEWFREEVKKQNVPWGGGPMTMTSEMEVDAVGTHDSTSPRHT